jgi:hypothetical protein
VEPRGRNRRQAVADQKTQKTAKTCQTVATRCDRLPLEARGKEGVNSSSLLEGFEKGQQMAFFVALVAYADPPERPLTYPQRLSPTFENPPVLA